MSTFAFHWPAAYTYIYISLSHRQRLSLSHLTHMEKSPSQMRTPSKPRRLLQLHGSVGSQRSHLLWLSAPVFVSLNRSELSLKEWTVPSVLKVRIFESQALFGERFGLLIPSDGPPSRNSYCTAALAEWPWQVLRGAQFRQLTLCRSCLLRLDRPTKASSARLLQEHCSWRRLFRRMEQKLEATKMVETA